MSISTLTIAPLRLVNALRNLGPIDIAIANAGLYSFGPTWKLAEQQWDETLAVVLKGAWITCKVTIPQMIARRRGKIICTASTAAFKGLPGLGHYTAAKHGVIGLVKTLARELAPYNINVNAICPTTQGYSKVGGMSKRSRASLGKAAKRRM